MDSFSSELEDGVTAMSLSLVSFGSDLDATVGDISLNLTTTAKSLGDSDPVRINNEQRTPTPEGLDTLLQRACSLTGLSEKKKKEVEAAIADAAAARAEVMKTEVIIQAYEQVLASDKLPQLTRDNARKLWRRQQVQAYVGPGEHPGVLGLRKGHLWVDCPQQLSEKDCKIIKLAVEAQLIENARELKQAEVSKQEIFRKLSGNACSGSGNTAESDHTSRMATLRTQLNYELDKFYKLMVSLDSLLETIVQLKTNKMTETCTKFCEGWEAKAHLLKQKARLLNTQIETAIYTEDSSIIPAMQHLEKDLDLLHSELEVKLAETIELQAAYDRVRSPQYDQILEEYCQVTTEIKSLKYLIDETRQL